MEWADCTWTQVDRTHLHCCHSPVVVPGSPRMMDQVEAEVRASTLDDRDIEVWTRDSRTPLEARTVVVAAEASQTGTDRRAPE